MDRAWKEGADTCVAVLCIISQRRYFGMRTVLYAPQLCSAKYSNHTEGCRVARPPKTPGGHLESSPGRIWFLFYFPVSGTNAFFSWLVAGWGEMIKSLFLVFLIGFRHRFKLLRQPSEWFQVFSGNEATVSTGVPQHSCPNSWLKPVSIFGYWFKLGNSHKPRLNHCWLIKNSLKNFKYWKICLLKQSWRNVSINFCDSWCIIKNNIFLTLKVIDAHWRKHWKTWKCKKN